MRMRVFQDQEFEDNSSSPQPTDSNEKFKLLQL
ncbi:hypothetical protein HCH_04434 [Hahella chejuensis KCTC 2396]|uniref:Uncharacterized protein n=1 Tax=Hahella chejuensis (strain KCTC 2396) TaxID=349521 RepID=Q2SDY6_HAHCH|nr:hypothetical protein HCH_04434 [Hahella chejuensis KCTC 2396]